VDDDWAGDVNTMMNTRPSPRFVLPRRRV
jgi:hypothetical protein